MSLSVTGLVHLIFERMSFDHCSHGRCVLAVAGGCGGGHRPPLSWSAYGAGGRDEEDPWAVAMCRALGRVRAEVLEGRDCGPAVPWGGVVSPHRGQEQTLKGWWRRHSPGPWEGARGGPGEDAEQVGPARRGRGCRWREEGLGRPVP